MISYFTLYACTMVHYLLQRYYFIYIAMYYIAHYIYFVCVYLCACAILYIAIRVEVRVTS